MISLENYIKENEYIKLRAHPSGEMYTCDGSHICHITDIQEEYIKFLSERHEALKKEFDKYYSMSDDMTVYRKYYAMDLEMIEIKKALKLYSEKE